MPPACPLPQLIEDGVIHACECAFAHNVPMIVCPTTNFGIEQIDQIGGRHTSCVSDGLADAIQESLCVLLGRLDEQFPVGVPAHVLSEEIKAFLHVSDDRLFRREFQPSLLQKLLDEGFDLSFQYFLRFTGDDKVISVADEIHRSGFTSERLETFLLRELLLQESFEPVQRAVSERWRNHSPYTKGNFQFERIVRGWRTSHPVLDLRLKR